MNFRYIIYCLMGIMVIASLYLGYRLLISNEPLLKSHTASEQLKDRLNRMDSDHKKEGPRSVWNDPRLTGSLAGKTVNDLKTSAEIENNLKVLMDLYDQGRDEEFLAKIQELIAANPNVKEYVALLGDYYYNDGNWSKAEESVRKLIELDPKNVFAKTTLGEVVAIQGRYDEGYQIMDDVLNQNSRNLDAMYGVLSVSDMKGTPEVGIKRIEALGASEPSNGNVARVRADIARAQNKPQEALKILQDGAKNDPTNSDLHRELASEQTRTGNTQEAITSSKIAVETARNTDQKVQAMHVLWQAELQSGNRAGALAIVREIRTIKDSEVAAQTERILSEGE